MRDILDLLDSVLTEANLGASEIPATKPSTVKNPATGKMFTRPELFLQKVKGGTPFDLVAGGQVTIDPKEARQVAAWIKSGSKGPSGTISLRTTDGRTVKNTELLKTEEFGSKSSQTIAVKGSDIFDVTDQEVSDFGNSIDQLLKAGGFPASEMYDRISNSASMKKLGKLGDAVIYMAREAAEGRSPTIPKNLNKDEIKAIELYASEYLGVLGLISGATRFKRGSRQEFDKFIGSDLSDMIMFFPKDIANPLADSFSVVNDETGHAVKISSKAVGKGAPPALSGVKMPAETRKKYPKAASFYDTAVDSNLSAFSQPFAMMNWLHKNAPAAVPTEYGALLPFSSETIAIIQDNYAKDQPIPKRMANTFAKRISPKVMASASTMGGKIWYAVTKDVIEAVNDKDAVKDFQKAIIQSLGFNFIQLYTNIKGDKLVTEAFWPATISGEARLKTKGSSLQPTSGKISVEISPGKGDDDMGAEVDSGTVKQVKTKATDLDKIAQKRSGIKAAPEQPKKYGTPKTLGRTRQK